MVYRGKVQSGPVVLDPPGTLPDGAKVSIEVIQPEPRSLLCVDTPPATEMEGGVPSGLADACLSSKALSFSLRIGVVSELSLAIETARKCFSIIGNPAVDLVQDPETDASYLVVEIQVRGDVRDIVMAHRNFALEKARLLGPRREIISLHYDII